MFPHRQKEHIVGSILKFSLWIKTVFLAHHICYSYSWLEYVDFCGLFVLFWCASFFIVIADRTMWIWRRWSIIMWNRVVSVWDGTRISLPCLPVNNPVWGFSSFCHTRADRATLSVTVNASTVFHTPSLIYFKKPHIHAVNFNLFSSSMFYGELKIFHSFYAQQVGILSSQ